MSPRGPIVRPKEPGTPSFPKVPHFHTCRGCPRRHKYRCLAPRCDWAVLRDCPTGTALRAARSAVPAPGSLHSGGY